MCNHPSSLLPPHHCRFSVNEMLETAFKMYCNLKTRLLVGKPSPVPNYDLDYKFGTAWNATVEGMAVIESAKAEDKANSSKRWQWIQRPSRRSRSAPTTPPGSARTTCTCGA